MKTIWINLISIIRRFKFATFLNVAGFAAASAAFIIMMMQLYYEYTFEDYHPNAKRIYRGEKLYDSGSGCILTRPLVDLIINSSPYIEAGTLIAPYSSDCYFTVVGDTNKVGYVEDMMMCYPDITKMFHFDMLEGNADCLVKQGSILIPESMARKLFGSDPAVGKVLRNSFADYMDEGWDGSALMEIGGVYKDFPGNTQLDNRIYTAMPDNPEEDWINSNYMVYVMLNKNASPQDIEENFANNYLAALKDKDEFLSLQLVPLKNLYYQKVIDGPQKTGNRETSAVLLVSAFLIIIIAGINYTNFCTSMAPMRLKSINTQKVLGAADKTLQRMLLIETVSMCFVSFLLSLGIVSLLANSGFITFIDADMGFANNLPVLLLALVITLMVGVIAGLYPSYYMVKHPPAMVLKGSYGLSPAGKRLRTGLLCIQFIIAFGLIISSLFIYVQNNFLRNYNVGFNREQIAILQTAPNCMQSKDYYVNKLKENPFIEDVAFSMFKFGGTNIYMQWGGVDYKDESFQTYVLPISWNFLDVMDIKYEGDPLTPAYDSPNNEYLIPNRKLKEEYNMEANNRIYVSWRKEGGYGIPGFMDNVNPMSLKYSQNNFCFMLGGNNYNFHSYVKIAAGANMHQVVDHIRSVSGEIDPAWPFEIEFFDTIYNNMYKKEQNLSKMIFLFSILAVIISIVGVFALIVFETQYRYKEIGIRKVHGASIKGILWMFNRYYLTILLICFIVAAPFAWYGVSEWLKGFAYKTPLYWWVYVLSFIIVMVVTVLTVTLQSWRIAITNPSESMSTE